MTLHCSVESCGFLKYLKWLYQCVLLWIQEHRQGQMQFLSGILKAVLMVDLCDIFI